MKTFGKTMFETDDVRFVYRVVGIALYENYVLLQRSEHDMFWFPPGGRVRLLETAQETLINEMREELVCEIDVVRLLWVVENFCFKQGKAVHEIAFYYLITIPPVPSLYTKETTITRSEGGTTLFFQWFPLEILEQITLYPTFLKQKLQKMPTKVEHIVHTDEGSEDALFDVRRDD